MATASFIEMLRKIRGTGAIDEAPTDGIYYEIALKDTNGNLGMYGDIVAKHTEVTTNAGTSSTDAADAAASAASASEDAASAADDAIATAADRTAVASDKAVVEGYKNAAETSANNASTSELLAASHESTVTAKEALMNPHYTAIDNVGAITADVTDVAGIKADVTTVAGVASDVTTVASISADVVAAEANAASASASKDKAQDWAIKSRGEIVETIGLVDYFSSFSYAMDAKGFLEQITELTAESVNVAPNSDNTLGNATATYNSTTGVLTIGVPQGIRGRDLRIDSITAETGDDEGKYTWHFTDGDGYEYSYTTKDLRVVGPEGPQGDALSMTNVTDNGDGTFTWQFSAGDAYTTPDLTGPKGNTGSPGVDVKSIHWISNSDGLAESSAGTTDTYGVYSTEDQNAESKLGEFTQYNGANGDGAGDMLYSENLANMESMTTSRSNLGVDSSAEVDNKILVAVPDQTANAGRLLQTDGTVTEWGYNPTIGSW